MASEKKITIYIDLGSPWVKFQCEVTLPEGWDSWDKSLREEFVSENAEHELLQHMETFWEITDSSGVVLESSEEK